MNRIVLFFFILMLMASCGQVKNMELASPDKQVKVMVSVDAEGVATYQVFNGDAVVLEPSRLGVQTSLADFKTGLRIAEISEAKQVTDSYETPMEKRVHNTYEANEQTLTLENKAGDQLQIVFRISNGGVAFRYFFPKMDETGSLTVLAEHTTFNFPESGRAWLHPHADVKTGWSETQPSYEENYYIDVPVGTASPLTAGWSYPALFNVGETWVLISESGLEPPYCGTRLAQQSSNGEYAVAFPQATETVKLADPVTPIATVPFYSNWHTLAVGSLSTIVESNLVTALAAPVRIENPERFKSGISSWSWGMLKDNSVNYNTQKEFIDHAANMGWSFCLVDVNWDTQIGFEKIQELIDYATSKNVGIVLWYNSAGEWNSTPYTPKGKLLDTESRHAEFGRISKMGVKGVKIDFWPGDGPSAIQYYYDMLSDAAKFGLTVNFHGTTVARGWSRTFPNLVSMESVKGFEFTTFEQPNNDANPVHCTILPFSRNVVGHMDYTPVTFDEIPGIERRTSNSFELALSILFQSGVQHIVETPQSMARQPEFVVDFMKNLPTHWDDVKLVDGFPGKYVVLARQFEGRWYVAGINAQATDQELSLDVSKLTNNQSIEIITDGENARSFNKMAQELQNGILKITLKSNGGFVTVL